MKHPVKVARAVEHYRMKAELAEMENDPLRAAEYRHYADAYASQLRARGRCERCGRALSDPESIRQGFGPECIQKAS